MLKLCYLQSNSFKFNNKMNNITIYDNQITEIKETCLWNIHLSIA